MKSRSFKKFSVSSNDTLRIAAMTCLSAICLLLVGRVHADYEYVFPKLISSHELTYPDEAQKRGWEGWAYYTYSIGLDGQVTSVEILDSNGIEPLNEALIEYLQSMRFEPALLNGEPIIHTVAAARTTFVLTGQPRGATRTFNRRYKRAQSAIADGDLKKAESLIGELREVKHRSLYEELYLQSLLTLYFQVAGQKAQAYAHLQRVLDFYEPEGSKEQFIKPEYFIPFLITAYQYEVNNMMLGNAFRSANLLQTIDPRNDSVKKVQAHAAGLSAETLDKEHAINAELSTPIFGGSNGTAYYYLLKNEIEIDSVEGEINSLRVRCKNGTKLLDHESENAWIIPKSWAPCWLSAVGEVGASFKLTEMPDGNLKPTR